LNNCKENFLFEDNGDFVYGMNECPLGDIINVTYSGDVLALKYDFSSDPGDEFTRLAVIEECNRNSYTWAERDLTHLYLNLGVAVTEKALDAIIDKMRPAIHEFKQAYDDYHSDDRTIDFYALEEKYRALKELCERHVEDGGLGCDGMRGEFETAGDVYYADPEGLDFLVYPDTTDEEIDALAIEEFVLNGVLFHPREIASVLSGHRDDLIERRLELVEMMDGIIIETSVQYLDAQEFSHHPDAQSQETRIRGVVVNEAIMPELQLTVRCSQAFVCIQPGHRDYAEPSDFEMAPDIKWDFIGHQDHGNPNISAWEKAELEEVLRSNTDIACLNPLVEV